MWPDQRDNSKMATLCSEQLKQESSRAQSYQDLVLVQKVRADEIWKKNRDS